MGLHNYLTVIFYLDQNKDGRFRYDKRRQVLNSFCFHCEILETQNTLYRVSSDTSHSLFQLTTSLSLSKSCLLLSQKSFICTSYLGKSFRTRIRFDEASPWWQLPPIWWVLKQFVSLEQWRGIKHFDIVFEIRGSFVTLCWNKSFDLKFFDCSYNVTNQSCESKLFFVCLLIVLYNLFCSSRLHLPSNLWFISMLYITPVSFSLLYLYYFIISTHNYLKGIKLRYDFKFFLTNCLFFFFRVVFCSIVLCHNFRICSIQKLFRLLFYVSYSLIASSIFGMSS